MMNMLKLVTAASLLLSQVAGASEFRCPPTIDTRQSLATPVEGFEPMEDTLNGTQQLQSISIYDGHPKEGASLVPDNEGKKGDPYWTNTSSNGLWMACFYRQSTVRLVRELPKSAKKCTLKFKKPRPGLKHSPPEPDVVVCE